MLLRLVSVRAHFFRSRRTAAISKSLLETGSGTLCANVSLRCLHQLQALTNSSRAIEVPQPDAELAI